MGSMEEAVLCVYHNFAFFVVYSESGQIPLCHKENGKAPK